MTPAELIGRWPAATARGRRSGEAEAVLSALGMTAGRWATFWREYPAPGGAPARPPRATRDSASALRAEQDRADEAALAAALAATPGLPAVTARAYTRAYWLEVYGGAARRAVARRQARYLAAVAGPGWAADPGWRTSTATALANGMIETGDFSAVPILADALEDAGCDDGEWLRLMRDPAQPWFRGAGVLDTLR